MRGQKNIFTITGLWGIVVLLPLFYFACVGRKPINPPWWQEWVKNMEEERIRILKEYLQEPEKAKEWGCDINACQKVLGLLTNNKLDPEPILYGAWVHIKDDERPSTLGLCYSDEDRDTCDIEICELSESGEILIREIYPVWRPYLICGIPWLAGLGLGGPPGEMKDVKMRTNNTDRINEKAWEEYFQKWQRLKPRIKPGVWDSGDFILDLPPDEQPHQPDIFISDPEKREVKIRIIDFKGHCSEWVKVVSYKPMPDEGNKDNQ